MKSSISTNSAFSGAFLPSPDMFNQSASSSYVGFTNNLANSMKRSKSHAKITEQNEPKTG